MNKDDICFHSVLLDEDACKGCTICVTGCPVEAIRVRRGKARILEDRCIDCGECIRRCPNRAKKANSAPLASLDGYDWKIALPAPSFYGQFPRQYSIRQILGALLAVGFDDIIEVAEGAKIITQATKEYLKENGVRPLISSSCPAIVRLIQVRFPTLLDSIIPLNSPMEIAADIARRRSDPQKQKGLEVGIFFISPCPAKITAVKYPLGQKTSQIDQVLSIKDIYLPVLQQLKKGCKEYEGTLAPSESTGWSCREGEAKALGIESWISVDGITETTSLLESIEDGTLEHIQFVEAMACPSGCAGGPLTVQHPAQTKELIRYHQEELLQEFPKKRISPELPVLLTQKIHPRPILQLDKDFNKACLMMKEIEEILPQLPGLDCGSCGAPNCRALAEDIVRKKAHKEDCIFVLKEEYFRQNK